MWKNQRGQNTEEVLNIKAHHEWPWQTTQRNQHEPSNSPGVSVGEHLLHELLGVARFSRRPIVTGLTEGTAVGMVAGPEKEKSKQVRVHMKRELQG